MQKAYLGFFQQARSLDLKLNGSKISWAYLNSTCRQVLIVYRSLPHEAETGTLYFTSS